MKAPRRGLREERKGVIGGAGNDRLLGRREKESGAANIKKENGTAEKENG